MPPSDEVVGAGQLLPRLPFALDCSYVHVRRYGHETEGGEPAVVKADFAGVTVPNRFVFDFGMDVDGAWRNLSAIRALQGAPG